MKRAVVMKAISYARLQRRYGGQFIARQNGKVLASGATYQQLLRAISKRRMSRQRLIVGYVPPKDAICIYAG
jgi:hypothetical protein